MSRECQRSYGTFTTFHESLSCKDSAFLLPDFANVQSTWSIKVGTSKLRQIFTYFQIPFTGTLSNKVIIRGPATQQMRNYTTLCIVIFKTLPHIYISGSVSTPLGYDVILTDRVIDWLIDWLRLRLILIFSHLLLSVLMKELWKVIIIWSFERN